MLEIGGGDAPLLRPNMDFRELPTVDIVADLEKKFPVPDASYDGVFAKFVIEHITWRKSSHFVSEIHRILRPGGLAVLIGPNTLEQCREIARRGRIGIEESAMLFGGQEGTWDESGNYHKAAFSFEYVQKLFSEAGFSQVVAQPLPGVQTDMVIEAHKGVPTDPVARIQQSDWYKELQADLEGKPAQDAQDLCLNVGSFTVMLPRPWVNIDILDLAQYAEQNGFLFEQVDVRQGLPYGEKTVKAINASHLVEHLSCEEAKAFLAECRRVLQDKGWLRIGTPDLGKLVAAYQGGKMSAFDEHQPDEYKASTSEADKFWRILTPAHKTIYDWPALRGLLEEAGFKAAKARYNKKYDMYPDHTLYARARPAISGAPRTTKARRIPQKLMIALVSGSMLRVPPDSYGGLEQIVADLAEALAGLGHNVTIFAPDGSKVSGSTVVETGPPALKVDVNWLEAEQKAYEIYKGMLGDFDIVHDHTWFGSPYLAKAENPALALIHTHHGGLSWRTKPPGVEKLNMVAISSWMAKVYQGQGFQSRPCYNGINLSRYPFKAEKGDRLLFVGRLDKLKQPHVAVEVANKLGMGLDLVGGTFVGDKPYLETIRAMCDGERVRLHPDAPHEKKLELMQSAKAVLMPSNFNEPFGLVHVEAAACGTPTIALRDGALPEIIVPGVTGFLCDNPQEMAEAIGRIGDIAPDNCRCFVEENFSREIMAQRYLGLYRDVLRGEEW